ncbi:Helix-turn-helix domain-containing protein [Muriicola jejuensis]|uniref:Helix-turn-helix domain-containing protein n=3 Tax=Muriicola jejuensis TaxID=504488 RepID=A0A6P0UM26_9FLAO|nr:helix-turn-helix domain-containing protein [Muriicola jejuensis]SMP21603.1 Helix-turn-helix domain-containing protein [Muriicola jejuensis]
MVFKREKMAMATGYSLTQCTRKVKKLTGKTPYAFLKDYRLRKALRSLHDSKDRIGNIAKDHGFKNSTHFTRSFREAFGILPSKYAQLSG